MDSQWRNPNLDPLPRPNPSTDNHKEVSWNLRLYASKRLGKVCRPFTPDFVKFSH